MKETGEVSVLQVMQSAAGYYVGTYFVHVGGKYEGLHEPNSRESGYFATYEEAEKYLDQINKGEEDTLNKEDRVNLLIEAQGDIDDAITRIRQAIEGTSEERYCESYIIGHLTNWAHGEGTLDTTIPKLIEAIEEEF